MHGERTSERRNDMAYTLTEKYDRIRAAAIAAAARLALLFPDDRRNDDADHNEARGDDDEDFIPSHFFSCRESRAAAASLSASPSSPAVMSTVCAFSGCFLFQSTIAAIAAAMSTAKIKQVHHHEPMR